MNLFQRYKKKHTGIQLLPGLFVRKLLSLLMLIMPAMLAVGQGSPVSKPIRITGTRFTYSIFQKWIDEYIKIHPGVQVVLNSKIPADSADIVIASYALKPQLIKEGHTAIAVTRYAQLPVVSSRRSDVAALQSKGFNEAAFRQIYFADSTGNPSLNYHFAVYKREKPACASRAFANHFGNEQKDIRGIGVNGDDRDLLDAVKKDSNGISYNNLGFIYDIQTRRVIDSIAIVPIDLNNNGKIDNDEKIYGSLDEVLNFIEHTKHPKIPAENVNVIIRKDAGKEVTRLLQWILTKGQQYNHEYGFLNLDASLVQSEQRLL